MTEVKTTQAPDLASLSADSAPLELSGETMQLLVDRAMERIVEHITTLPDQPLHYSDDGAALSRSLIEDLPEQGEEFGELLSLIFDRLVKTTYNTASPGYLAYIPGGGLFHAALADLIANSINRYIGVWIPAPGLVQLEVNVVRWFCQMVGYPEDSEGILTTGGSMANFTAIVTARRNRLPDDFLNATIYCSDQVHHSITKAATMAGFPESNIRMVPSNDNQQLRLDALTEQVAAHRAAGSKPFLIVASAGTVNTGAVDDFTALADLAEREEMWLHVDGAYGGFFVITERGKQRLTGLERADSITLDPHKGLFLPYGTGSLLVREPGALLKAHQSSADYMPEFQQDRDLVDFCEISPELSRDFRGLRVWLPFKMHGAEVFREALDEKLDLTHWATEELRDIDGIEIVAEPQLSIVAFRLTRPGASEEELETLNRDFQQRINDKQHVFLTSTNLESRYVIRICVLSFRTHLDRMQMCLDDIRASVSELQANGSRA